MAAVSRERRLANRRPSRPARKAGQPGRMPQASMPQGTRPPALSEAIYVALEPPLLLEAQHIAAIAVPDIRDDVFASACRENNQRAAVHVLEHSLKTRIVVSAGCFAGFWDERHAYRRRPRVSMRCVRALPGAGAVT